MAQREQRPVVAAALVGAAVLTVALPWAPASGANTGVPSGPGRSFTSAQVIAAFNRIRASNGLPPVTEDKTWDNDCRLHDIYMSDNNVETHYEQPGKRGYTAGGAFAGQNAVLAWGSGWSQGNPWSAAPIHLSQMVSPALRSVGAYEYTNAQGIVWECLTTWPGYPRGDVLQTATPKMYSYPGNGATGVATQERSYESPVVPNKWVGLPTTNGGLSGGLTGTFIYLYWTGRVPQEVCTNDPQWQVCQSGNFELVPSPVAATLRRPDGGLVDARLVSQKAIAKAGYAGYIPYDAALLVPAYPLQPHLTYTVRVTFGVYQGTAAQCPRPPSGGLGVKADWCVPHYPAFSAQAHFTTGAVTTQ